MLIAFSPAIKDHTKHTQDGEIAFKLKPISEKRLAEIDALYSLDFRGWFGTKHDELLTTDELLKGLFVDVAGPEAETIWDWIIPAHLRSAPPVHVPLYNDTILQTGLLDYYAPQDIQGSTDSWVFGRDADYDAAFVAKQNADTVGLYSLGETSGDPFYDAANPIVDDDYTALVAKLEADPDLGIGDGDGYWSFDEIFKLEDYLTNNDVRVHPLLKPVP